ncbi:MAG: hypothetical protein J7K36_05285 [Archaeoglobaceae archaeon]|nr:hypothetical protein [Archaeoglobaceae archaeon]HDD36215.1 hypothetical protein [Archaeoglobus veneficus]
MIVSEEELRKEAIKIAAHLLAISARTAPKSKGEDDIEIVYVDGEELEKIADKMIELASEKGRDKDFIRDAESVKKSQAVLLIGVNGGKALGLNCGACGFDCNEFKKIERKKGKDFVGPNCLFKLLDLGIALGSAVKLAGIVSVDNRIMYRIGTAAKMLGYAKADVVMGIPLTALGKNPFFDRIKK